MRECDDRHHMRRAGMFIPAQATQIVHCVLAISHRTADWTTGRSLVTGDGSGIKMTWLYRRQCVVMHTPWLSQTDRRIYDVTIARHQTLRSHIHIACLEYISQSIHQAKQIASYVARESNAALHRDHPPTYRMLCRDCLLSVRSSVNKRLWKFKDRYKIIRLSHPYYPLYCMNYRAKHKLLLI